MTEQTIQEIVKSFAYGYTAEIEQKKAELKEGGWLE